jgi:hypothetical protein
LASSFHQGHPLLARPKVEGGVTDSYRDFLATKRLIVPPAGIPDPPELNPAMFGHQRAVTRWALRRGRAALWLSTGLGKTLCAQEWARVVAEHTERPVLIVTPLAVAQQFKREGERFGIDITVCREADDMTDGINVVNYDRLERMRLNDLGGVVLDESSRIKDFTSATRNMAIEAFKHTPFKLECSATPSPNDHTELGNHAEFLGVMSRTEMLSMFFVHDGETTQEWRLKGHAKDDFWRWVSSWAMAARKPSDLGFDDTGYNLPPLNLHEHVVGDAAELARKAGLLFGYEAKGLEQQRGARNDSLDDRVAKCAELANATDEAWIVWCDLNSESTALTKAIRGAVEIRGSDKTEDKEQRILDFLEGRARVLVSKPSICGSGLNLQGTHNSAFVGLSNSWEAWFQAIRRQWRFGQEHEVNCHMIIGAAEGAVIENLRRKQAQADEMAAQMIEHMGESMRLELGANGRTEDKYEPRKVMHLPDWMRSVA